MKPSTLNSIFLSFLLLLFISCTSEDMDLNQLELNSFGFVGTLPEGWEFQNEHLKVENTLIGMMSRVDSSGFSHILMLTDTLSDLRISLSLPMVKFYDEAINPFQILHFVRKYNPYEKVLEALLDENKPIVSKETFGVVEGFFMSVTRGRPYKTYTTHWNFEQPRSYIKVLEIKEGLEVDRFLRKVRNLEVLFEVDLKLYHFLYDPADAESAEMKGLLRMRFKENVAGINDEISGFRWLDEDKRRFTIKP
jgi:hypothetical protein